MTAIPDAVDALLALCEASSALSGVQIIDGQPGVHTEDDVIVVGFSPDRLAVEVEVAEAGLRKESEVFHIVCLASSATGGPAEFKPLRDRAKELYDAVKAEVRGNQTLGGTVAKVRTRTAGYAQEHIRNEEGHVATSAATFEFVVTCTAIT